MEKAKKIINLLDFEGCLEAYNKLKAGNKMIDLIFDRMEEIDEVRFDKFLG